jgi:hypothetical protein
MRKIISFHYTRADWLWRYISDLFMEISGSNLGWRTDYPDSTFPCLLSVSPFECLVCGFNEVTAASFHIPSNSVVTNDHTV